VHRNVGPAGGGVLGNHLYIENPEPPKWSGDPNIMAQGKTRQELEENVRRVLADRAKRDAITPASPGGGGLAPAGDATTAPSPQPGALHVPAGTKEVHPAGDYTYTPWDASKSFEGAVMYHGTKADVSALSKADVASTARIDTLYGPGLYLSDNYHLAKSYAVGKGKGPEGKVLGARLKNVRLVDLEKPLHPEVRGVFDKEIENLGGEKLPAEATGKEVFTELKESMRVEGLTTTEAYEIYNVITEALAEQGFDGYLHQGGQLRDDTLGPHNVAILFDTEAHHADGTVTGRISDKISDVAVRPPGAKVAAKAEPVAQVAAPKAGEPKTRAELDTAIAKADKAMTQQNNMVRSLRGQRTRARNAGDQALAQSLDAEVKKAEAELKAMTAERKAWGTRRDEMIQAEAVAKAKEEAAAAAKAAAPAPVATPRRADVIEQAIADIQNQRVDVSAKMAVEEGAIEKYTNTRDDWLKEKKAGYVPERGKPTADQQIAGLNDLIRLHTEALAKLEAQDNALIQQIIAHETEMAAAQPPATEALTEHAGAIAESGVPTPLHDATLASMGDPTRESASETNLVAVQMHAFVDAGVDPHAAVLWPVQKQYETIRKMLLDKYKFKDVRLDTRINWRHALDQMLNAYSNMQWGMHSLGLEENHTSLSGRITLLLGARTNVNSPFGSYTPATRTIRINDRANSFMHEWAHALDHMLIEALGSGLGTTQMASRRILTRGPGNAANLNTDTVEAFSNVLTALFTDEKAGLAKQMFALQQQAAAINPVTGRPTTAAMQATLDIQSLIAAHASEMYKGGQLFNPVDYWIDPAEMLARAIEAWAAHNMAAMGHEDSTFVTKTDRAYLTKSEIALKNLYPKDTQRNVVFMHLNSLRDAMRRDSILGNGKVGSAPRGSTDADMMNPENWTPGRGITKNANTIAQLRRLGRWLTDDVRGLYDIITKPRVVATEIAANMGWDIDNSPNPNIKPRLEKAQDVAIRAAFISVGGRMSAIVANQPNAAARELMAQIQQDWDGMPGRGRLLTRPHYEAAREQENNKLNNALYSILTEHGLVNMDKFQNEVMMKLLTGQLQPGANPSNAMIAASGKIRQLMNKVWYYAKDAKLPIGFASQHMPRMYDYEKIIRDPVKFVRQAALAYGDLFDHELAPYTNPTDRRLAAIELLKKEGIPVPASARIVDLRDTFSTLKAERWNEAIRVGEADSFDALGPDTSFIRERVLPGSADTHLYEFMNRDVRDVLTEYFHKVTARAEYTRRVGPANERLNNLRRASNKAGVYPEDLATMNHLIQLVAGRLATNQLTGAMLTAEQAIMYYGTIGLMDRAAAASLFEFMANMMRTRSFKSLAKNIQALAADAIPMTRGVERAQLAEALGVVLAQNAGEVMSSRLNVEIGMSKTRGKKLSSFFMRTLLEPLTKWQRRAAIAGAEHYVRTLLQSAVVATGEKQRFARYSLRELGIGDNSLAELHAWAADPAHASLTVEQYRMTAQGNMLGDAITRVARGLVLATDRVDKPELAQAPGLRMMYGLMAYSQAFSRHFIGRMWQEFKGAPGFAAKMRYFAGALPGIMTWLIAGTMTAAMVKAMFGVDNPNATENDKMFQFAWGVASRSNVFGSFDFLAQAAVGLYYHRPLVQVLSGAQLGLYFTTLDTIARSFMTNSDLSNLTERNRTKAIMQLIAPYMSTALIGSPRAGPLLTGTVMWATSAAGRDWMATQLHGPPTPRRKGDPNSFGYSPPRPRRSPTQSRMPF
jgi:hypothetical protein